MSWNIVYVSPETGAISSGIVFPSNGDAGGDARFDFTGTLPPIGGSTILLKAYPIQHDSYYTFFFFGRNDGSLPSGGNNFWGCHPYPDGGAGGSTHKWEIATDFQDDVTDENGNSTAVTKNQWYSQAASSRANGGSESIIDYYWDLATNVNRRISHTTTSGILTADTSPALMFGASPWAPNAERASARLRGFQVYSSQLAEADIVAMRAMESDAAVISLAASRGISSALWYCNMNPTPDDISDKSGAGHNPAWISANHGTLWTP